MRLLCCLTLLSMFAGCSDKVVDGPPAIKYGQAECAECGMILSDERYASAALIETADGRSYLLFDDVGDQIVCLNKRSPKVIRKFVHDYNTREWIDAEKALFVKSESFHTPMGSGLVAFRDPATAEAKAKDSQVSVQSWAEVEKAGR